MDGGGARIHWEKFTLDLDVTGVRQSVRMV